jgi:type I restriction enzyme M protein
MLTADIKQKIDSARNILVGKIPTPTGQVEQITLALVYKFMNDIDEQNKELGGKLKFFTGDYSKYAWTNLLDKSLSAYERVTAYGEGLEKMHLNPNLPQFFRNVFRGAFLPFRDPEVLTIFLRQIDEFQYGVNGDLGDAFEYLLQVMGTQGDAGQFLTPRHWINFIVDVVDPQKTDKTLDPADGTAGFIISTYLHILKHNTKAGSDVPGSALTYNEKKKLSENLVGYDISHDMVRLSLVNLYLHGFADPRIYEYDTLGNIDRWDDDFDCIVTNPPFMTPRGGVKPHRRFSIQAKRSEVLFVDYIMEHLNPNGKAGIIVPEGIIFQSATAYKALRKMMIDQNFLYAVVSLPAGIFQPYSGVKTSILFMDRVIAKKTKDILFVKVENDGFDLGAQRRPIDKNDIPKATEILKRYKMSIQTGKPFELSDEDKQIASLIPIEKISKSGDYNLSGDRYKETKALVNQRWPMVELGTLEKEGKIDFLRGQGLSKNDISEDGKCYCIHYGDIYTLYNTVIKQVINKTNFDGKIISVKGDVLVPATTTADAMGIAVARSLNEDGVIIGGDINIVRTKNKFILSDYLALLISNPPLKLELAKYAKGANILHLSNSDLKILQFPLPPLEVQQEIVSQLDIYQKIIDGAKQVVDNYKPEIKIDPEWEELKLKEISENLDSKRKPVTKSDRTKGIFPYYGASGIVDYVEDYIFDENLLLISEDGANLLARVTPIAFSVSGKVWVNNHAHVLKFKSFETQKFVELYLNQTNLEIYITGAAQPKLNQDTLNNIKIPLPPLDIQKQIVARIEEEQQMVNATKKLIELYQGKIKEKIDEVWGE